MPIMTANDETPSANFLPTPAIVLRWIAAAGDGGWFPSRHARENAVPRDALDGPLAVLREAGLVRVRDWVKGAGQQYALTPDGAVCVDDAKRLDRALAATKPEAAPTPEPTTFDRGETARQSLLEPRTPLVVPAIVVANVFWFFVGLVLATNAGHSANGYLANADLGQLQLLGALSGFDLVRGDAWRLVAYAFNHGNLLHLVLVAAAVAGIGLVAESVWGPRRFLLLYLASAVGGGCLAMAVQPASFLVGASGAFWGILCSLPVWLWWNRGHLPDWIVRRDLRQLGGVFVLGFAISFVPGVSWAAHFGGGIAGALVGAGFLVADRARRGRRGIALATVLSVVGLSLAGLALQSRYGTTWRMVRLLEEARNRGEFEKAVQPALKPIQYGAVDALYRQAMNAIHLNVRKPDLPDRAAKLRDDAAAFATWVESQPRPGGSSAKLPEKYRDYAFAVRDLAEAIRERLAEPDGSLSRMEECRRNLQDRWTALAKIE